MAKNDIDVKIGATIEPSLAQVIQRTVREIRKIDRAYREVQNATKAAKREQQRINRAWNKSARTLQELGGAANRAGNFMGGVLRNGIMAASAAMAGLTALTVKTGASFEQSMANVGSIASLTNTQMDLLERKARLLGATTAYTATQTADGMADLARAGLDVNKIIGAIGPTLFLAGAAGSDLTMATKLMARTFAQFGLEAHKATEVADVFTIAMQNSLLDMESLDTSMRYAGAGAGTFKWSIQETTAAVALFMDQAGMGSTAGTQFRHVLNSLAGPTKAATRVFGVLAKEHNKLNKAQIASGAQAADIAKTIKDKVNPEYHGFESILNTLKPIMNDHEAILKLVNKRSAAALSKILKDFHQGTSKYKDLIKLMELQKGQAERTYRRQIDTVQGQAIILRSKLEELMLTLFDTFKYDFKEFVTSLGNYVDVISHSFRNARSVISNEFGMVFRELGEWLGMVSDASKEGSKSIAKSFILGFRKAVRVVKILKDMISKLKILGKWLLRLWAYAKLSTAIMLVGKLSVAIGTLVGTVKALAAWSAVWTGGLTILAAAAAAGAVMLGEWLMTEKMIGNQQKDNTRELERQLALTEQMNNDKKQQSIISGQDAKNVDKQMEALKEKHHETISAIHDPDDPQRIAYERLMQSLLRQREKSDAELQHELKTGQALSVAKWKEILTGGGIGGDPVNVGPLEELLEAPSDQLITLKSLWFSAQLAGKEYSEKVEAKMQNLVDLQKVLANEFTQIEKSKLGASQQIHESYYADINSILAKRNYLWGSATPDDFPGSSPAPYSTVTPPTPVDVVDTIGPIEDVEKSLYALRQAMELGEVGAENQDVILEYYDKLVMLNEITKDQDWTPSTQAMETYGEWIAQLQEALGTEEGLNEIATKLTNNTYHKEEALDKWNKRAKIANGLAFTMRSGMSVLSDALRNAKTQTSGFDAALKSLQTNKLLKYFEAGKPDKPPKRTGGGRSRSKRIARENKRIEKLMQKLNQELEKLSGEESDIYVQATKVRLQQLHIQFRSALALYKRFSRQEIALQKTYAKAANLVLRIQLKKAEKDEKKYNKKIQARLDKSNLVATEKLNKRHITETKNLKIAQDKTLKLVKATGDKKNRAELLLLAEGQRVQFDVMDKYASDEVTRYKKDIDRHEALQHKAHVEEKGLNQQEQKERIALGKSLVKQEENLIKKVSKARIKGKKKKARTDRAERKTAIENFKRDSTERKSLVLKTEKATRVEANNLIIEQGKVRKDLLTAQGNDQKKLQKSITDAIEKEQQEAGDRLHKTRMFQFDRDQKLELEKFKLKTKNDKQIEKFEKAQGKARKYQIRELNKELLKPEGEYTDRVLALRQKIIGTYYERKTIPIFTESKQKEIDYLTQRNLLEEEHLQQMAELKAANLGEKEKAKLLARQNLEMQELNHTVDGMFFRIRDEAPTFTAFFTTLDGFGKGLTTIFDTLWWGTKNIFTKLLPAIKAFGGAIKTVFNGMLGAVGFVFDAIQKIINLGKQGLDFLTGGRLKLNPFSLMTEAAEELMSKMEAQKEAQKELDEQFRAGRISAAEYGRGVEGEEVDPKKTAKELVDNMFDEAMAFIDFLVEAAPVIIQRLSEKLPILLEKIKKVLPPLIKSFLEILRTFLPVLVDFLVEVLVLVVAELAKLLTSWDFWAPIFDAIGRGFKKLWNFITTGSTEDFDPGGVEVASFDDTPNPIAVNSTSGMLARFSRGDTVIAAKDPFELLSQSLQAVGTKINRAGRPSPPSSTSPTGKSGSSTQNIDIAVMAEGRVLDAIQVQAMDRGHAPKIAKKLRKASGVKMGFNRGRYNNFASGG